MLTTIFKSTIYEQRTKNYDRNKSTKQRFGSIENKFSALEKIDADKKFNPTSIIAFGYHLDSKNLRELSENVKSYTNKKKIDIDFITRY